MNTQNHKPFFHENSKCARKESSKSRDVLGNYSTPYSYKSHMSTPNIYNGGNCHFFERVFKFLRGYLQARAQ